MAVTSRRSFLRWFHELEDDDANVAALETWDRMSQQAVADGVVETGEVEELAALVIELADDDLVDFDHIARSTNQFGMEPGANLQHAKNFRSTTKARDWLREAAPAGPSFAFHDSPVGQVAGRDIANYVSLTHVLDAAKAQVDQVEASEEDREAARGYLEALRGRAAEAGTGAAGGAGAFVAGRALAQALGLPI